MEGAQCRRRREALRPVGFSSFRPAATATWYPGARSRSRSRRCAAGAEPAHCHVGGTVRPHTLDAPTTRLVCALQGTWAWRGRSVVDVGRRCGRSVSVLFDPPRPRPGTRVLARVRVRGVVPPGQNRPTATLAGALSLNASSGPPSAWTFHGTHAFFRPCAGVCFVSTGGRRGYCHRSDPRGWRRDGKRVARAQSRKLAGGSTAGTVDGVGTAARFRQVAFLFDAATFPQRSEFEHGVVMVCLQG